MRFSRISTHHRLVIAVSRKVVKMNILQAVSVRFNITPAEIYRQAYRSRDISWTEDGLMQRLRDYVDFETLPYVIEEFCEDLLNGKEHL